jgi:hypothetical protein
MRSLYIIPFLLFILSACSPVTQTNEPWQLADLRMLEMPDAAEPSSDLVAVYTRLLDDDFQIRLDFLDLQPDFNFNIYILFDTSPSNIKLKIPISLPAISPFISNQRWDLLISLPHQGNPQTFATGRFDPNPEVSPSIQFDSLLDFVTISFNRMSIPSPQNLTYQIFVTTPDGMTIKDMTPSLGNNPTKPFSPAPMLIAFNDTFPAFTPAQALRRWDGAHTGPNGERHGLTYILTNAQVYNIPVILLDLKNPGSLSALDFMNALPQIKQLIKQDLLLIPDLINSYPAERNLQTNLKIASDFGFSGSNFVYSTDGQLQTEYKFQFMALPDLSHLHLHAGKILIPLPDLAHKSTPNQVGEDGLSLQVRRQLLATALSPDPADLVILGGSLPFSAWGDSDISKASMAYIAAHPWILPLNSDQLQTFYIDQARDGFELSPIVFSSFPVFNSQGKYTGLDSNQLKIQLSESLQNSPRNLISDLAWQMFFTLSSPQSGPMDNQLHVQYINQVESMLAASLWMEAPVSISDCSQDIDYDLINECVFSNSHIFAIIELDGGRISFLFERNGDQVHQLVGPSSQFFVGLSDSSLWKIDQGPAADPSEIPGAFSDSDESFLIYRVTGISDREIILDRMDDRIKKVFRLEENGISVDINSFSGVNIEIPLMVDPQTRFLPGWKNLYISQNSPGSYKWGVLGITNLEIFSTSPFSVHDFKESALLMGKPENPNLDYPPGHFLPFPLALIKIPGEELFSVKINVER